jgi:glycosyltransferase involved in cell wall biosynthesis
MSALRILIYSHGFAPQVGGVETVVMSLATGLAGLRQTDGTTSAKVTVVTRTPRGAFDDESLPFQVVRQPGLGRLFHLIREADVVHLAGPSFLPMLFGLLPKRPVVVEHSGYQAVCPNGLLLDERTKTVCPGHFMARHYSECLRCNAANVSWRKSLAMLLLTFPRRWMCGKVARNVVPTAHVGGRVALPRTVTIYHGVAQPPALQRSEKECFVSPVSFAYVGRLVSEKGLDLLVESARRLNAAGCTFCLKFIGDGPERSRLEVTVDTLGLRARVTFTGYLQGDDLESALADVTALVMPSISEETAGLSAMEHMMRGRLVVAADIGGLGEIVGEAGLKFRPGDAEGLASCLRHVLDEPNLAKALGKKARQRALQLFLEERMDAEHLAVYRQLLGGSGASPEGHGAVARPLHSPER